MKASIKFISDLTVLSQLHQWFEQNCSNYICEIDSSKHPFYHLNLALTEGFTNAVRHAHQGLPTETPIEIELRIRNKQIEIRIWDQGKPFDPTTVMEPEPGTLREGGYGWFLLRRLADQVVYERCPDGRNCLLILSFI